LHLTIAIFTNYHLNCLFVDHKKNGNSEQLNGISKNDVPSSTEEEENGHPAAKKLKLDLELDEPTGIPVAVAVAVEPTNI